MNRQQTLWLISILIIVFFMTFPFLYGRRDYDYIMHVLITGFFYAILASSWSMLSGYAGQFSFGHMAFMGLGAYGTALFSHYFYLSPVPTNLCTEFEIGDQYFIIKDAIGVTSSTLDQDCLTKALAIWDGSVQITPMPIWIGILLGSMLGGIFGLLIGMLVLRLRAAYLALFTLGFSEILRATISAEIKITRGQAGIELPYLFENGITVFGHEFSKTDKIPPYYVMFFLLLACMAVLAWLAKSRFGLFVRALREDEDAAAALGVNTVRFKIMVFVITSTMAALAGAVQAHYVGIITPNNLMILQMSLVVAMAVIGGLENFAAAAIGAIIIQFLLELLRESFVIGGVEVDMTLWRLVFFGALLMITLRFYRNGLITPIIEFFTRAHVASETVEKRMDQKTEDVDEAGITG